MTHIFIYKKIIKITRKTTKIIFMKVHILRFKCKIYNVEHNFVRLIILNYIENGLKKNKVSPILFHEYFYCYTFLSLRKQSSFHTIVQA